MANPKIAVLPAADGAGAPINGSHRAPVADVRGISPLGDGSYSMVYLERVNLICSLPAVEVAKSLGWD
jgi:hypothetical protein